MNKRRVFSGGSQAVLSGAGVAILKLTKRNIDAVAVPSTSERWFGDTELKGFWLRVAPSGTATFALKYRIGRASRTYKIGRYGALTPDEAREMARAALAGVAKDVDPARERREKRDRPTLNTLAAEYLASVRERRSLATWKRYDVLLRLHALPKLGSLMAAEIEAGRVDRVLKGLPTVTRNRTAAVLSALFNWAKLPNSAKEIERGKETKRQRFLSSDELTRLGAVLVEAETVGLPVQSGDDAAPRRSIVDRAATDAIRLLLLTGCRLREILSARWDQVDSERGVLHLPQSKTGQRDVVLSAAALALLTEMHDFKAGDYLMGKTPRPDLKRPWLRVRAAAGLEGVRLHDLRHSFASVVVSGGASLPIVAGLLGHSTAAMAERYAHLSASPVRAATDRAGATIAAALRPKLRIVS